MQPTTTDTPQYIQNKSFDPEFQVETAELLGHDLANNVLRRVAVDSSGYLKVVV